MRRKSNEIWVDLSNTVSFLKSTLSDGPIPLDQVITESTRRGISRPDLNTARRSLRIITVRKLGISYWKLPDCKV